MLRNRAQSLVRFSKRKYYSDIFNHVGSANEVWRGLKHLGLIRNKNSGMRLLLSVEELNEFFERSLKGSEPDDGDSLEEVLTKSFNDVDFHWDYVTPLCIGRAISRAKSNFIGMDGVPLRLLKITICSLMPILEHLFNFSLLNGVFPKKWKSAIICPIPKVRNFTEVQHYRPISILPALSKALERVVFEQISAYLDSAGIFDPCQSAYRNNHSTQTCLIRMLDEVRHAADCRMVTLSVF